jgi:hypothetical protein
MEMLLSSKADQFPYSPRKTNLIFSLEVDHMTIDFIGKEQETRKSRLEEIKSW